VPVALLGLLYFVAMAVVALTRIWRVKWMPDDPEWFRPAILSTALAATAFVAYLTYVELFELEASYLVRGRRPHRHRLGLTVWVIRRRRGVGRGQPVVGVRLHSGSSSSSTPCAAIVS
jgi:hypothetical protein